MSRQIVVTLPEWTEIKGINNKQFADLLPTYDELLNLIKNGTPIEQEPKVGHWIWCGASHKCSNCGEYTCFSRKLKHCPYCGAEMESED